MTLDKITRRRRTRRAADAPTRVIAYTRVNTDEQADSGAGLAAQRDALQRECEARGWADVRHLQDAGYSAASLDRPALQEALMLLETGQADVLLVSKLDRLSRSVQDFANLSALASQQGWALRILDLGLDMTSPQGEMMAGILAVFAQFERRLIGERTRAGMAAKKAGGVRIGRPVQLNDEVRARIVDMRASGLSYPAIAKALNNAGIPSARGSQWHAPTVHGALNGWRRVEV